MKKQLQLITKILFIGIAILSFTHSSMAQDPGDWFITEWDMSKPFAIPENNIISFDAVGESTYELIPHNGSQTIYGSGIDGHNEIEVDPGEQYTLKLFPKEINKGAGLLHAIKMSSQSLMKVTQWGATKWRTAEIAPDVWRSFSFEDSENLQIDEATDKPDLSSATTLAYAFKDTDLSNPSNIGTWDVSAVENMSHIFDHTSFNGDISKWVVSNVTDMSYMFHNSQLFNQNIGGWIVDNVTDMSNMFNSARAFNQDISNWNVSNVTDMKRMFADAIVFNQNIGGWNVSQVTNMYGMFNGAYIFNQDISDWNVTKVDSMYWMFAFAYAFNQDISSWDVSNTSIMEGIFTYAEAFDQNLGAWNLKSLDTDDGPVGFSFGYSGMSCDNYSRTLHGWADNSEAPEDIRIYAFDIHYSPQVEDDRDHLINNLSWVIDDAGKIPPGEGCLDPLPVRLLSFDALARDKASFLQWTSIMEDNFAGYIVERSQDGKQWKELGFVKAQAEEASYRSQQYQFTDKQPAAGVNYYRLKQMDKDGAYEYSGLRMLKFNEVSTFSVYPNPAGNRVTIAGLEGAHTLQVRDMTGRIIRTIDMNATSTTLDISDLHSGMYLLHATDAMGYTTTQRFIKE